MSQVSPNARALLNTIRMAEGTWAGGSDKGYGIMFGGGQFDWRQGHPDRVVRAGGYASAAAGAYQFMPATWQGVTKQLGIDPKDFSPAAQDRAALQLVRNRGVDPDKPIDDAGWAKLAPEWASLPTRSGNSFYGQPVKRHGEINSFYRRQLGNPGNIQAATGGDSAPAAASGGGAPLPASGGGDGGSLALLSLLSGGLAAGAASPALQQLPGGASAVTSLFGGGTSTAAQNLLRQQAENLGSEAMLSTRRAQLAEGRGEGRGGQGQRMAGSPGRAFFARMLALSQPPQLLA